MTAAATSPRLQLSFFHTVVLGGALIGLLDGLDAIVFYSLAWLQPLPRPFAIQKETPKDA